MEKKDEQLAVRSETRRKCRAKLYKKRSEGTISHKEMKGTSPHTGGEGFEVADIAHAEWKKNRKTIPPANENENRSGHGSRTQIDTEGSKVPMKIQPG